jgi:hypothetical protein
MKTRTCLSCGAKSKGEVCRPKVITSVHVEGEKQPRKVFYVRREILFDADGRVCHSPDSVGVQLAGALSRRNVDAVDGIVWDALNFVYNGDVPKDWLRKRRKEKPVPLAI